MLSDYTYAGPPDISPARFRAILTNAGSPGAPEADGIYEALVRRGVRPTPFLAHWLVESALGINPQSVETRYETHNPGAVRTIQNPEHRGIAIATDRGTFIRYPNLGLAAADWADRMRGQKYEGAGLLTVRQVLPRYAPAADGNSPDAYIDAVLAAIERWTEEDAVAFTYPGSMVGRFASPPVGIVIHSSRSGRDWSTVEEFRSTCNWAMNPSNEYGWNATIGPGVWEAHITARQYGINCGTRESARYIAVEFSQAKLGDPIVQEQVTAFADFWRRYVVPAWPHLGNPNTLLLPAHSELPQGVSDGKTDPWPRGTGELEQFRARLYAALKGGAVDNPYWDQIGAGIKAAMQAAQDAPVGPESYAAQVFGADWLSKAPGEKALYIWDPKAKKIAVLPWR